MSERIEYRAPAALEVVDDRIIHDRMLSVLPPDIDKTQGGFAYDFTMPAAIEKSNMMYELNEAIQLFFPAWSYGFFLDLIAKEVGIARRSAAKASGYITVTGAEGKRIPAGFKWSTPSVDGEENVEFETVDSFTIDETKTAQVYVRCTQTGPKGNVPANSITLMVSPTGGIMEVTNAHAFTGGTEDEDDESLRARIDARDKSGESSHVGSESDYIRWAKEVPGVGDVIVISEWMGKGTGTVKLVVMDSNGSAANQDILNAVMEHIMSPNVPSKRLAPLDTILTVVTATVKTLTISVNVQLEPGTVEATAKTAFENAVKAYFAEAKTDGAIRHTRIGGILSATAGVIDYTNLKLNDAAENVPIASDEYPTLGTVTWVVT